MIFFLQIITNETAGDHFYSKCQHHVYWQTKSFFFRCVLKFDCVLEDSIRLYTSALCVLKSFLHAVSLYAEIHR